MFTFFSQCDQGAIRPNNEDAIAYGQDTKESIAWAVVADGMGGHNAGEVASDLVIRGVERRFNELMAGNHHHSNDFDWSEWMDQVLQQINNDIFHLASRDTNKKGMGTTVVFAILVENRLIVLWVGDSRAYLLKPDGQFLQLTSDHTLVQSLVDKGALTQKEAENANNKNMLSRAFGIKYGVEIDQLTVQFPNNSLLLLSTDGLHDSLSLEQLNGFSASIQAGQDCLADMVNLAIQQGSRDNISIISLSN